MADNLAQFRALEKQPGTRCTYERLELSPDDQAALDAALATPQISGKAIELWAAARGQYWRQNQIARHRRGDCRCGNG